MPRCRLEPVRSVVGLARCVTESVQVASTGMDQLAATVAETLTRRFGAFVEQSRALVADLSEEEFWVRPYTYGNSVGHLLLHVTGNLRYYIGGQMAGTGYCRDREREFTDNHKPTKALVLRDLSDAVSMVVATIQAQSVDSWSEPYSAEGTDETTRFGMMFRCAHHFHHHLGQIIYLSREFAERRSR